MYTIGVQLGFSAAHFHGGADPACGRVHGHNYRVEVEISSDILKNGMVIDFKRVRKEVEKTLKEWDHQLLNKSADFVEMEPTTENISRVLYKKLKALLAAESARLSRIKVWETTHCWAAYEEPD